jgi:hypothetical protein
VVRWQVARERQPARDYAGDIVLADERTVCIAKWQARLWFVLAYRLTDREQANISQDREGGQTFSD